MIHLMLAYEYYGILSPYIDEIKQTIVDDGGLIDDREKEHKTLSVKDGILLINELVSEEDLKP